jgi:hypothetical protein
MFVLFSGEGPTDCGQCQSGTETCEGADYDYGPMTSLADQIIEPRWGFSPLDCDLCGYISEQGLSGIADTLKAQRKSLLLRGKKRAAETGYFYRNARALAVHAKQTVLDRQDDDVIAILFRDSDGTASAGRGLWDTKVKSIRDGFEAEDFARGVPMVPKPKSEAWLICGLKDPTVAEAAKLETRSGNDHSPKSLKKEFAALLDDRGHSTTDVVQLVEDGDISVDATTKMPSFQTFQLDLESVL